MNIPRRLILVAVTAGLGLLLVEWSLSTWLPLGAPIVRLDETLLHRNRSNARSLLILDRANGGDWIRLRTNSIGLRGGELRPRAGQLRLAVYGDSFVFAGNAQEEDTFVHRLEVELSERLGKDVEALNAGVTGFGPDQALLKLEEDLSELAPDLVVLCLCAHNDHGDLVRNRLFETMESGGLLRLHPALDPALTETQRKSDAVSAGWILPRLFAALVDAGAAHDAPYLTWYLRAARREHLEATGGGLPTVHSLFKDYWDADLALEPDSASALHKERLMAGVLERFRSVCEEGSTPLFALVVPSALDAATNHPIAVDPALYPGYERRALTDALVRSLDHAAIDHVDLFDALSAHGGDWAFHLVGDFHWSPRGQAVAAQAVGEAIANSTGLYR